MSKPARILIFGAGLAGLSAALRLRSGYRIFERRDRVGGLAETEAEAGYRFDRTGHLLHLSDRRARDLVFELIGERLIEIDRRARIFSHGVYTRYPFQANLHGLPPRVAAECLTGFCEAWARRGGERVRARTFEEFIHAHFGPGIARHFMVPYNRKLWGVHPREITDAWCERFVPTPRLAKVVEGAVGVPQERLGYNARFYYPRDGIGELPAAMARRAGRVELGRAPRAIDTRRRRVRIGEEWIPYRAIVSSLPLDALAKLLVDPPERIAAAGAALRCTSLRYLDVALERPAGTPWHWSYVPERRFPFYRVGAYSNFSPRMAPAGKGALYVELAARSPVRLQRLRPRLVDGLVEMGLIERESDIAFVRPRHLPRAYVLYDAARERAVPALLEWLEARGIFAAGRYARFEYAAMEDAIAQGIEAANRAAEAAG